MRVFHIYCLSEQKEEEKTAFFRWISERVNNEESILLIRDDIYYKASFKMPFCIGATPGLIEIENEDVDNEQFAFIINGKENKSHFVCDKNWHKIANGFFFDFYENKKRFENKKAFPLRFGLTGKEKQQVMLLARFALEMFLKTGERPNWEVFKDFDLNYKFNMVANLNAAIWVNGELRGSLIIEKDQLWKEIIDGVIGASQDFRFKPVSFEELKETRIEIVLISDLSLPVPQDFIQKNEIIANKGYKLTVRNKSGWFLPEVFNSRRFMNLSDMLDELSKKIGLITEVWKEKGSIVELREIDDFIEDEEQIGIVNLRGPIAVSGAVLTKEELEKRMCLAADWLVGIQEADGNFPKLINPATCQEARVDWPRSVFAGWALVEYGKTINNEKYINAGEKHFDYLRRLLKRDHFENFSSLPLILAYAGHEALALWRATADASYFTAAFDYASKLFSRLATFQFETITFQHIAGFFAELSFFYRQFLEPAQQCANVVKENFEKNISLGFAMNLAEQAEIVNVFNNIYNLTQEDYYREFSRRVADWLSGFQFKDGSFPIAFDKNFVYTRGTGKIFEILAVFDEYKISSRKALDWLLDMQYTKENTFFIRPETRSRIIGGFRHDYFNQEAWIDSAGHFLLGTSRILTLWK